VAVYDIDLAGTVYVEGKVRFAGTPSTAWAHLVGHPNPGKPWGSRATPTTDKQPESSQPGATATGSPFSLVRWALVRLQSWS
jgi:hypothetical protein